jgi:hypothetical protein
MRGDRPPQSGPNDASEHARRIPRLEAVCAAAALLALLVPSAATAKGWSIEQVPAPGLANSELRGVSCASPSACIAVGSYTPAGGADATLAERWNGKRWSIQATPNPTGGTMNGLSAVSCPSPSACVAVGTVKTPTSAAPFVERWNGKRWSIEPTPNVDGLLSGVSCTSPSACTTVGLEVKPSGSGRLKPLAERWNGRRWSIEPTPAVYAGAYEDLEAVSCASTTACFAVGTATDMGSSPIAERWNGTKWAIERPRRQPTGTTALTGVSCISPSTCITAGAYYGSNGPLAGRWTPNNWSIQPIPGRPNLIGVSCPATTACTAVGGYSSYIGVSHFGSPLLAEAWNGTRWSIQPTPSPAGAKDSGFAAVSCATTTTCTAVGSFDDAVGRQRVLVERWTGTR